MRVLILALAVTATACSSVTPLDRGLSHARRGNDAAARAAFDEAILRSPGSAPAYAGRGLVRARQGDVDGAIEDYTRALTLGDIGVLFNRGVALIAKRNYQGAIADFTVALSANPQHARALFARGTARSLAGDPEQARADWRRAIELERDPAVRRFLQQRQAALPATGPGGD